MSASSQPQQLVHSRPAPGEVVVAESLSLVDPAAAGYRLNHNMLRITDPEKSMKFYIGFMGMSLVFKLNCGPFTFYYLAYPSAERGDQSPLDILKSIGTRSGLLELIHAHEDADGQSTTYNNEQGAVGFGHLGFTVPDVEATLQRAEDNGIKVIKWPSDVSVRTMALPGHVQEGAFNPVFLATYTEVGFLSDPDGYCIEILPVQLKQ